MPHGAVNVIFSRNLEPSFADLPGKYNYFLVLPPERFHHQSGVLTSPLNIMSPAAIETQSAPAVDPVSKGLNKPSTWTPQQEPLAYSGSLDLYESFDLTNIIGREFPGLQLSEILHDDAKIRDLAILGIPTPWPIRT